MRDRKFCLNREVDFVVNRMWCPCAGCETVRDIGGHVDCCFPQNVHCPTCSMDFCSKCKNPWHSGLSCEQSTRCLTKEGGTDLMQPCSDIIKCCPMCNILIEKNEGCAVMYCRCCRHRFCWHCLASLKTNFLFRHSDKGSCKNKSGHSRAILSLTEH
jgi:E3 ubiquitin-protein ligase RNF144